MNFDEMFEGRTDEEKIGILGEHVMAMGAELEEAKVQNETRNKMITAKFSALEKENQQVWGQLEEAKKQSSMAMTIAIIVAGVAVVVTLVTNLF